MTRSIRVWPSIDPSRSLEEQLDALADELRLYRDLRYEPGSEASYQLTGHFAQLGASAAMLRRPAIAQRLLARSLLEDSRFYLRRLQNDYDA